MNMKAAGFINIDTLDITKQFKGLVNLQQAVYSAQDRTDQFGATSSVAFASDGTVLFEVPLVFFGAEGHLAIPIKVPEITAVFGTG